MPKKNNKLNEVGDEVLNKLYSLVLDPATHASERKILLEYKNKIEKNKKENLVVLLSRLERDLRPLAVRRELSPQVSKFYTEILSEGKLEWNLGRGLIAVSGPM